MNNIYKGLNTLFESEDSVISDPPSDVDIELDSISDLDVIDDRLLFLSGDISNEFILSIIIEILKLDRAAKKDIILFINSVGGDVTAGFALYDVMNAIRSDIITICIGECASMAALIFMNGTKGKRYIFSNSEMMIHQVSSKIYGKCSDVEEEAKDLKEWNNKILKIISEKTGKSIETIRKDVAHMDKWFDSSSAVDYGLADKIINSIDEIYK